MDADTASNNSDASATDTVSAVSSRELEALLVSIEKALTQASSIATFTCGGRILIDTSPNADDAGDLTPRTARKKDDGQVLIKPISIRWGEKDGEGRVISIPASTPSDEKSLQDLVDTCKPATFGLGGQDVLDEAYRKAGALSPDLFMTDFCPYASGIIDIVSQLLLPSISGELRPAESDQKKDSMMCRGLRAELYKLNVYSGPTGMFKKHVDTPRGDTQVGSLVVCLPVEFQGGSLAVRHHGQEVVHDWSSYTEPAIHWAAFYSDVEHEVLPVTTGHRLTLTYNLFLAPGTGLLNTRPSTLLPAYLPLHNQVQTLLDPSNGFLPEGGYIGIPLIHSYPHTHPRLHAFVPAMLKGVDMALFQSILTASLRSILIPLDTNALPPRDTLSRLGAMPPAAFQSLLREVDTTDCYCSEDSQDSDDLFERIQAGEITEDEEPLGEDTKELFEKIKADKEIIWLHAESQWAEMSKLTMVYGNQAELSVKYSTVALVVKIPSIAERQGLEDAGAVEDD